MAKRALVIGASGLVGGALLRALEAKGWEVTGTAASRPRDGLLPLDLGDANSIEDVIRSVAPEVVFLAAAFTNVDACEQEPEKARRINALGPQACARACNAIGAPLVFYSSDYVFDGVGGPFAESAAPRPLSVYGRSKREGEQAVMTACRRAIVIRTSVVYGPEGQEKNFVYQLIRACRAGQGFRPAVDQRASPSYNPDVAAASVELAERELLGLWHVAGSETLDRYAFALLVCREFALEGSRLTPVKTAELKQKAARPLDGGLDVRKAQAALRTPLRGSAAGLAAMHRELGGA